MKPLISLRDEDIFPKDYIHKLGNDWQPGERIAVRCIVLDDQDNIALCGTKYKLLPGGGVDEDESLEQAVIRECLEEIGCNVEIIKTIGITEEYRDVIKRHQITHCFVARLVGEKGTPQTTQDDEQDMKVYWHSIDEALEIFDREITSIPFESYNSCFNVRVQYEFLKNFQI
ncbi:MAG: NUDIX domain-containing protein [Patescibacteria group bacterium]